jgi:hypothetical protein
MGVRTTTTGCHRRRTLIALGVEATRRLIGARATEAATTSCETTRP